MREKTKQPVCIPRKVHRVSKPLALGNRARSGQSIFRPRAHGISIRNQAKPAASGGGLEQGQPFHPRTKHGIAIARHKKFAAFAIDGKPRLQPY